MKVSLVKKTQMGLGGCRLDASFHMNDGIRVRRMISNIPYDKKYLREVTQSIFTSKRGRRIYVDSLEHGVPFLGGATMLKSDVSDIKILSKRMTPDIGEMILDKDWILISCSGTIGNCVYTCALHKGLAASQHIMRVVPNNNILSGVMYAFLASKYGYAMLTQGMFGSVIQEIEPEYVESLSIPVFPASLQEKVHSLITDAARLREEADAEDKCALGKLKKYTQLRALTRDDYNYFGFKSADRQVSCFCKSIRNINLLSINAFNYSKRTEDFAKYLRQQCHCISLGEMLDSQGIFSTGSFPRLEYDSPHSVLLINQSDIFDMKLSGKMIARRGVKTNNLVKYGEVIIAGVGTLGENETFCRTLFANETLDGQLISGEFLRMNTKEEYPSGYLYTWLHSEYGFRFIRATQAGTKLCRPIQKILLKMPVPLLSHEQMLEIHDTVVISQTHKHQAAEKEKEAIRLVEEEIEKWQK